MNCRKCGRNITARHEYEELVRDLMDRIKRIAKEAGREIDIKRAKFDEYADTVDFYFRDPDRPFGFKLHLFMLTTSALDPDLEDDELQFDWELQRTGSIHGDAWAEAEGWSVYEGSTGRIRDGARDFELWIRYTVQKTLMISPDEAPPKP